MLRIGQFPDLCADFLVELRFDHDLLHLAISQRTTIVRIEVLHHVQVVLFLVRLYEPGARLLLEAEL